jgi:hypothetical protein
MVCRWPCGSLDLIRCPHDAQLRSGSLLVCVQSSSMNQTKLVDPRPAFGPLRPSPGNVGTVLYSAISVFEVPQKLRGLGEALTVT